MNRDKIIQRTMPPDLRAALSIVQSAIDDGDTYLRDPAHHHQVHRIISLLWLSITLHGYPGREEHMIRLLNGKYRCLSPIFYGN